MKQSYAVICSYCGEWCDVPFKPREGSEVCCKECYKERNGY